MSLLTVKPIIPYTKELFVVIRDEEDQVFNSFLGIPLLAAVAAYAREIIMAMMVSHKYTYTVVRETIFLEAQGDLTSHPSLGVTMTWTGKIDSLLVPCIHANIYSSPAGN